jgi:glycosyltransferase involved in cell wall biosynthesis
MKVPILIFSDAVAGPSGLARIARDIATRLAERLSDVATVATIGYGAAGSSRLPFTQYSWSYNDEWIIHDLPEVWEDFAGDQKGIFLSIQDPSRMLWFARPETCSDKNVAQFLVSPPFKKWGYFPIDASGPNGKLSYALKECLKGYDRILAYSEWSEKIILNSLGISASEDRDLQQLPHGIDTSVFYPRGKKWRQNFGQLSVRRPLSIADKELLVGVVATNQPRKDYGLAIQVCAELAKTHRLRLWIHTDSLDRHWSLPYLLTDYGMNNAEHIVSTSTVDNDTLAKLYSSCDVTLGIGNSEGFGYPIFESLACGTPCIHGNNGGAPEHMPKELLVEPLGSRHECVFNCVRNVHDPMKWVERIEAAIGKEYSLPEHLDWGNLWTRWDKWFRKGIEASFEIEKSEATIA